ncbi:hypothetical protein BGZ76_005551 [Entomortierella beljakovae]|nr:hypothetical protein BGZ76_005551 [Entomortierella beljakovae]
MHIFRYNIKVAAKIDRGFFLASSDWTCYRRNYFQISASFSIQGLDSFTHSEVPCLLDRSGELIQVNQFLICIGAQIQNGEKAIELVQHTPKRDKGPQITPSPTPVRAGGELGVYTADSNKNVVTFERVQFKTATANNGKRRAAQQYYQVHVDLYAETDKGEQILVATSISAPLVVRGRSPGHYADNQEDGTQAAQPIDGRYYRNDSISSAGGAMSVNGDYPYYPNYGYGPSYPYQSLGSASHIAASQDPNYYDRRDSESYPTSPLSPGSRHPGPMEASQPHHGHPYATPQVHHGFNPASVSPDMYSSPNFIGNGADSPTAFNRQDGHYGYGSPQYVQYQQQQFQQQQEHYDQYQEDHEAQMADLRINSPKSPSSPVLNSARRQSFSSSLSKKGNERGVIGTTRKSRSISMSSAGITKRTPSKTRSSRTVPVSPTKELNKGLGISNDRIPEEEQS